MDGCTHLEHGCVTATAARIAPGSGDALLILDLQRDFLPGGALPLAGAERLPATLNRCIARFAALQLPVVATRDWHPRHHCSFHASGGPWPAHCIAGSSGAAFAPGLQLPRDALVLPKGTQCDREAYTAFQGSGLRDALADRGVRRLFVAGVATEHGVQATVLDALKLGYAVVLLVDALAGFDFEPDAADRAIARMQRAGAALAGTLAVA